MDKCQQLKAHGANAETIALALKADGKSEIESIKILRSVFDLSLVEAKEIIVRRDTGLSLSNYQEQLLPALEEAFQMSDREA